MLKEDSEKCVRHVKLKDYFYDKEEFSDQPQRHGDIESFKPKKSN